MNTTPLLTIAIPTYNRSACLKERLLEIQQQADERLQVLVSDNCSTDDTETIVRSLQVEMPAVRYHKNEINLGFDGNVLKLYELADTRYIWFLGDDDAILEHGISRVLDAITHYQPAVAIFRFKDDDDPFRKKSASGPTADLIYDRMEDLPDLRILFNAIFLSVVVIERNPKIDVGFLEKYANTGFIHITLLLFILSYRFKFCLLSAPIVRRIPEYAGSSEGDMLKTFYITPYKAVDVPGHRFSLQRFRRLFIQDTSCFKTLLASKSGMMKYKWERPICRETLREMYAIWGLSSLPLYFLLAVYYVTPEWCMRTYYFLKLIRAGGWRDGSAMYATLNTRRLNRERELRRKLG